jgi:hypothetical protein
MKMNSIDIKRKWYEWIGLYWHWYIINPLRDCYYECKYGFQRMFRGYDDTEIFSFNTCFLKKLPVMLQDLYDIKHGYPVLYDIQGEFGAEQHELILKKSEIVWNKILKDIIWYFKEANEETCSLQNTHEFNFNFDFKREDSGYYTMTTVYPTEQDKNEAELHFKREKELAEYRKECRNKGFELLKTYFDCLWD